MPTSDAPTRTPALPWWRYLGPWPLSPVVVTLLIWFTVAAYDIARLSAARAPITFAAYPPILVRALPAALAAGIVLWLFSRIHPRPGWRPAMYWLAVAVAVVSVVVVRFAMGLLPTEGFQSTPGVIASGLVRTLFTIVLIQSILGVTNYRLAAQVARTNDALQRVRDQQEQMVEADERVRAQVSSLLHDRVQAGLIAACLELADTAERADDRTGGEITTVVRRLEELRGLDVRRAARTLSPDLVDTDLQTALEDLGSQYEPAMLVTVSVDPALVTQNSRPKPRVLLGCYRIIEQALLNSAVHGRARHCHVSVEFSEQEIHVTIDDDGIGLAHGPSSAGLGSALTTTWVRILGGQWSRDSAPMGGVRVHARLHDSQAEPASA